MAERFNFLPWNHGILFAPASSCCLLNLCVSKSCRTCCSVADMCSNFILPLSLALVRHVPWFNLCLASYLLCRRCFCHGFWSSADSLCASIMSGCCCRSRMLCNNEACQVINSSSMFCNSALVGVFLLRGKSSNVGRPWLNM